MNPRWGEVWFVNFDPSKGGEIQKTRPAIVISSDNIGILPLRIVVPLTAWQDKYNALPWFVPITVSRTNGLSNDSAADTFQIKSVSIDRFKKKIGTVRAQVLDDILSAVMICINKK